MDHSRSRIGDEEEIERLLALAERCGSVEEGGALLSEVARLYEHALDDPDRALTTLFAASCAGDSSIRVDLRRLATRTGRWEELASHLEAGANAAVDPDARVALFVEAATVFRQLGALDRARGCCEHALDADPRSRPAIALLDRVARERSDLGELLDLFDRRIALATRDEALALRREAAAACVAAGRTDDAIQRYVAIGAEIPADIEALRALERLYAAGHPHEHLAALEALSGALPEGKERISINRRLATGWEAIGETRRAAEALEWVIASEGGDDAAFEALARLYAADQHWCAMIDAISRHAERVDPTRRAQLFVQLGMVAEEHLEDPARAIDYYGKADELAPRTESILVALARMHELIGANDRAAEHLEAAAQLARTPRTRAGRLARAAQLLLGPPADPERVARAERLLRDVLDVQPGYPPAARALAQLHLERNERLPAAALLSSAVIHAADDDERAELLVAIGQVEESLGDAVQALEYYRRALEADPARRDAQVRAADLLFARGSYHEALPLLQQLCEDEADVAARAERLVRLARVLEATGQRARAFSILQQAQVLAPDSFDARLLEGELLFADGRWSAARTALERVVAEDTGRLGPHALADAHARLGVAALELGDRSAALASFERALRLNADHLTALKRVLHVYAELGRWLDALGVAQRAAALERDGKLRARYWHVAGGICDEELDDGEEAIAYFRRALDEDPSLEKASLAIERRLEGRGDPAQLLRHYSRRVQQLGPMGDANDAERLRVWTALAATCDKMGDGEAARLALEVSTKIDGSQLDLRARFADACVRGGVDYIDRAIAEHHAILARRKGRASSYRSLGELYERTGQPRRALACRAAMAALVSARLQEGCEPEVEPAVPAAVIDIRPDAAARVPLGEEDWARLRHPDEELALVALWGRIAPLIAGLESQTHRALGLRPRDALEPLDARPCAVAAREVGRLLGVAVPDVHIRREQTRAVTFLNARSETTLAPVLLMGTPLLGDRRRSSDLIVPVAMCLANLRPERLLRLALPDTTAIAYLIDVIRTLATEGDGKGEAARSRTVTALRGGLSPVAFDQMIAVGRQLAERHEGAKVLAARWLAAADLTAARVAFALTGDLSSALQAIRADRPSPFLDTSERLLDLIWSSVTDELSFVCARVDRQTPRVRTEHVVLAPVEHDEHARRARLVA